MFANGTESRMCGWVLWSGTAELSNDPELLRRLEARGLDAMLAIIVHIDYAFFHCAKAYMRSRLWEPVSWPGPEEKYEVGFGIYFAESEEEAAVLDAGTLETYGKVQAAVDGNGVEMSTRADAAVARSQ